ncbi:hypothetical protein BDFB_002301 [Asbolus verrucosus]|uniref:Uncharacterized protein n=1 Tax=Asbolus verrucosus TaxID=1661398 RepID=A0A482VL29_ASBVE|nr:hypothetical protein BDFB_002301 [Asbolus verrucosus]
MGVVNSKSPLERRNTVLRRSQRKSIHGIKGKTDKLAKAIRKFKGTEENLEYVELKARIEGVERELKSSEKNLQPQLRTIHKDALKRTENCYKLLEDKLRENREKAFEKEPNKEKTEDNDDVFIEEVKDEEAGETEDKRRTVELKLVQVELNESPQVNKRASIVKMGGVPVMPGSIMEDMHRRTADLEARVEDKIARIRQEVANLELEISQFIGRKNGRYYNKIKEQLVGYSEELKNILPMDEAIMEQLKLCRNYIASCLSFLEEKGVGDDGVDEMDELPNNFSPRTMRTTYI